jgi:hypothetical protein
MSQGCTDPAHPTLADLLWLCLLCHGKAQGLPRSGEDASSLLTSFFLSLRLSKNCFDTWS